MCPNSPTFELSVLVEHVSFVPPRTVIVMSTRCAPTTTWHTLDCEKKNREYLILDTHNGSWNRKFGQKVSFLLLFFYLLRADDEVGSLQDIMQRRYILFYTYFARLLMCFLNNRRVWVESSCSSFLFLHKSVSRWDITTQFFRWLVALFSVLLKLPTVIVIILCDFFFVVDLSSFFFCVHSNSVSPRVHREMNETPLWHVFRVQSECATFYDSLKLSNLIVLQLNRWKIVQKKWNFQTSSERSSVFLRK